MRLKLYRRHRVECEGGQPEDLCTGQFEEGRRGWKRCSCVIHASGTVNGKFKRKQTGASSWDEANDIASSWVQTGSWETKTVVPDVAEIKAEPPSGITLKEALGNFTSYRENRNVTGSTLKKYNTFTRQLLAYASGRGYIRLEQLTVSDMDRFYSSWKDGIRSKAKKLERLKGFIKFCMKRKWLTENIAEDLEPPIGSSIPPDKMPFKDDELKRIYAACDSLGGATASGPGHRHWGGEDVKDFVMLSVYTGLRISDVATFNIAKRLNGNDIFLRMHKTRKELYTWIPDWLVVRLRARERKHGALIFGAGTSTKMRAMAEKWRRHLYPVFKSAGPFAQPPTPHRFRHTFVRILLQKGVPIADAAELVGDTEDVIRKHYAKWVPERQARLTKILREAFEDRQEAQTMASNECSVWIAS
jgi:integrase